MLKAYYPCPKVEVIELKRRTYSTKKRSNLCPPLRNSSYGFGLCKIVVSFFLRLSAVSFPSTSQTEGTRPGSLGEDPLYSNKIDLYLKRHLQSQTLILLMVWSADLESDRIIMLQNSSFCIMICFRTIKIASSSPSKLIAYLRQQLSAFYIFFFLQNLKRFI